MILGTIIADGFLDQLELREVCAWLCLFLKELGKKDEIDFLKETPVKVEKFSEHLNKVVYRTYEVQSMYALAESGLVLNENLASLMLDWCTHKDITRIAMWVDGSMMGAFVKSVMRVVSYLDVVKEVLLGLGMITVHNRLDNLVDILLGGIVTNESLYLRID